jgi:glycosyltransferase involved in cell wall biosynthesis
VPHGIEEQRTHIGGGGFVFLGTMEIHKGPDIVEKAYLKAFPTQNTPIQFYGDGSISISLPHSPAISREEVFRVLEQADCLILGSIWPENSPMIILEARACGCPIIAPDIGGIPELIQDGVDGFLYPVADVDSLAQKMLQSLDFQFNPRPPPTQASSLDQYEKLYRGLL